MFTIIEHYYYTLSLLVAIMPRAILLSILLALFWRWRYYWLLFTSLLLRYYYCWFVIIVTLNIIWRHYLLLLSLRDVVTEHYDGCWAITLFMVATDITRALYYCLPHYIKSIVVEETLPTYYYGDDIGLREAPYGDILLFVITITIYYSLYREGCRIITCYHRLLVITLRHGRHYQRMRHYALHIINYTLRASSFIRFNTTPPRHYRCHATTLFRHSISVSHHWSSFRRRFIVVTLE